MDLTFANLFSRLADMVEVRILMVGLDAAGKTTILYKLKFGGLDTPIPATPFNVETVQYDNVLLTVWNVCQIRPPWRHYFHNAHGLIFVVDSNNHDTIDEARGQLHRMLLADELSDAAVLIFSNKTDLPNAMNTDDITAKLHFNKLQQCHKHIQRACATSGVGLYEGLDWLSSKIKDMKTKPRKVFSHTFLPTECDFIEMIQIIRAGGNLGHDSVTATDPYKDHPDKLFGKLEPSILMRDEFCMNVNRRKGTQGFIRGVATAGKWKAQGGKDDVKKNGKKIGESTELAFYESREGETDKLTAWRMREFDTCPKNTDEGANCKTICVVFNKESRIRKLYEELKSLVSPKEKTNAGKGKQIVQDSVQEKKKHHEKTKIKDRLMLGAGARDNDIPLSVYQDSVNSEKRNVSVGETSGALGVRLYELRSRSSLKFLDEVSRRRRSKVDIERSEVGKATNIKWKKKMALKWINEDVGRSEVGKATNTWKNKVRLVIKPNDRSHEFGDPIDVFETNDFDPADDSGTIAQDEKEEEAIWVLDNLSTAETAAVVDTNNENSTEASKKGVCLTFTSLFSRLSDNEVRILMVGFHAAGKTTILNKLKLEETTPMNAFNMKTFQYKNLNFTVWDVGKLDTYSQSDQPWRQYFRNTYGLIFVVDSNDSPNRIGDASRELHTLLNQEELASAAVLVFANKCDLPNAMNTNKITDLIRFNEIKQQRKHIQRASATSGEGLYEGLDWLF